MGTVFGETAAGVYIAARALTTPAFLSFLDNPPSPWYGPWM
jgi:hypothetical protein